MKRTNTEVRPYGNMRAGRRGRPPCLPFPCPCLLSCKKFNKKPPGAIALGGFFVSSSRLGFYFIESMIVWAAIIWLYSVAR